MDNFALLIMLFENNDKVNVTPLPFKNDDDCKKFIIDRVKELLDEGKSFDIEKHKTLEGQIAYIFHVAVE